MLDPRAHAVEKRFGDLLGDASHEPRREAGNGPDDDDVGRPVQHRGAVGTVAQLHLALHVDGTARRLAVDLHAGPIRRVEVHPLGVGDELRLHRAEADRSDGAEALVGRDDLERLQAGRAVRQLLRRGQEMPDLVARRVDGHGAFEVHPARSSTVSMSTTTPPWECGFPRERPTSE